MVLRGGQYLKTLANVQVVLPTKGWGTHDWLAHVGKSGKLRRSTK